MPIEITTRVKPRLIEIAQRRISFDADQFFLDFFGAHGSVAVRKTFDQELDSHSLTGEAFTYDQAALPTSGPKKYLTNEGVRLTVPEQAAYTVVITQLRDGRTSVTIRTQRLIEQ